LGYPIIACNSGTGKACETGGYIHFKGKIDFATMPNFCVQWFFHYDEENDLTILEYNFVDPALKRWICFRSDTIHLAMWGLQDWIKTLPIYTI
jgi:hypothetical protein